MLSKTCYAQNDADIIGLGLNMANVASLGARAYSYRPYKSLYIAVTIVTSIHAVIRTSTFVHIIPRIIQ